MTDGVNPDRLAAVLLCSGLGLPREGGLRALTPSQWTKVLQRLGESSWSRPGDLLGRTAAELGHALDFQPAAIEQLARLLDRGVALAAELEELEATGLWVLTRFDEAYPAGYRERLGEGAPVVLFGAGEHGPVPAGGLAIIGSRSAGPASLALAQQLGATAAAEGRPVVSGGARGVDWAGLDGALSAGGVAVGVLAADLRRQSRSASCRAAIAAGQLMLVSPYHPDSHFQVGPAMARNKLIYCLADEAVVVASDEGSGGTWTGALEALEHGWVPVFVARHAEAPAGNQALLARGARPLATGAPEEPPAAAPPVNGVAGERAETDLFAVCWPHLAGYLTEPRSEDEVSERFALLKKQAAAWLQRACAEGRAERAGRPAHYQLPANPPLPSDD